MSFTNTTTHYSLPQYVATDKPKYLTDFNEAMADIDTQMYANAQAAATADGKAVAAKDVADGAVSSIGTLNTQINGDTSDPSDRGLAGDVSDNSGAINTINSLIGNGTPTTTDHTLIGAINELNAGKAEADEVEAKTTLIATSTTGNYGAQVASIASAFTALSADKKLKSFIMIGNTKFACTSTEGVFSRSCLAGSPFDNMRFDEIHLSDNTVTRIAIRTDSVTISDISSATIDDGSVKLYA